MSCSALLTLGDTYVYHGKEYRREYEPLSPGRTRLKVTW